MNIKMSKKQVHIEEYSISSSKDVNLLIRPLEDNNDHLHDIYESHRDNHYQFLFAYSGSYHFEIDFEEIFLEAPFILCIEPGQVHRAVNLDNYKACVLGIESFFLESEYQNFFNGSNHKILKIKKNSETLFNHIRHILETAYELQANKESSYISRSIFLLANSILCILIDLFRQANSAEDRSNTESRAFAIESKFKDLLKKNFVAWKSPSQYASSLFITPSHLNNSVKQISGKSVSQHIREYNMIEAKRLLYFTDLGIKEIAFQLGFEDPVYFGKIFKRSASVTPLEFRRKFHD